MSLDKLLRKHRKTGKLADNLCHEGGKAAVSDYERRLRTYCPKQRICPSYELSCEYLGPAFTDSFGQRRYLCLNETGERAKYASYGRKRLMDYE